ncbi:MAG TPA: right-handed parallel beta-helix repeat-containing protein [Candidatus Polarisedimenticolia bacterium]|nr:right-handed parallel beta-helix repeat-containing protein [Candidatus Polarisedimenticolia bacterium]
MLRPHLLLMPAMALCAASPAAPAVLHVDQAHPACDDDGEGTPSAPFCTIDQAADEAFPGDEVVVASGLYNERVSPARSGLPGSPIVLRAADGASVTVTSPTYGFQISAKSWIVVRGFTVADTVSYGIYAKDSSFVTIAANHVTRAGEPVDGMTRAGIYLNNTSDSVVTGNVTVENTDGGIKLNNAATRNLVEKNISAYNARGYTRAAPGIDVRSGGNTIVRNVTHHNEDTGIQIYNGAHDNLIVSNIAYDNGDHGIDVLRSTGQTILNNTVYRNVTAGINVEGGSTGCRLANNISVDNAIQGPRTRGNIRVDTESIPGTTIDHDLVWHSVPDTMITWGSVKHATLAGFVAATGMELHGLEADPLWVSPQAGDFRLTAGSPAIDSADSGAGSAASLQGPSSATVAGVSRSPARTRRAGS